MQGRIAVAALVTMGALALPAMAGAKTKTVQAGPFSAKAKQFDPVLATGNEYYRRVITIHKGDSVRWKINGPHSVTFVPKGDPPPAVAIPDPSNPVAGSNDAADNPFWFNGQPNFVPNPVALAPQGGKTFDASELQSSGLVLEGSPPPYKLKFKRKGTFTYLCVLHPGMAAEVRVVGHGRHIPSARKDKRAAERQLNASLAQVRRLSAGRGTEGLDKTIQAGNDRRSGATVFKFFPAQPSFKVGDTVTLQMAPRSTELHTFTLGPSNGKDAYNDQLAANLLGPVFDPRGIYPSEPPPAGIPSYNGTNHGNGFYNSGFLDADAASPLPASTKVRFAAPGNYPLICLIHPFMTATVTVTP